MAPTHGSHDYSAELEELRRRLLDLTARNRLLSYKHPKGRSVRIIQTDPAWFYDRLLAGQSIRVDYIPAPPRGPDLARVWPEWVEQNGPQARPKVAQWAKFKGYQTSYDLKEYFRTGQGGGSGRRGSRVQALYYPDDLERQLSRIGQLSRTAIEDSGANILYVAFGFLEWQDRAETSSHLAPLLLVPVKLESADYDKATRRKTYNITYSGEDVQYNLSLQQKLQRDFNLELPELDDEDDLASYSKKCRELLRAQPYWTIHAYVTLGFFQFGKLLLYLDLDPDRWPQNYRLDRHPLVSKVLGGEEWEGSLEYEGLYDPDKLDPSTPEFHLVQGADNSQHSAVIDAANGTNLVVEGPPGTGKSQTITNIIGVALKKGQSVLFVSEKMAALEVVRSRLEQVGLGDFCLELHSHRTQRSKLLDDLRRRLELDGTNVSRPAELQHEIRRFEEIRDQLNEYVRAINSEVPGFTLTIHSLLWTVSELRQGGRADIEAVQDVPEFDDWTQETIDRALGRLDTILARRRLIEEEVSSLREHPLHGLSLTSDAGEQWSEYQEAIQLIIERLEALRGAVDALEDLSDARPPDTIEEIAAIQPIADCLSDPEAVDKHVRLECIAKGDVVEDLIAYLGKERRFRETRKEVEQVWQAEILDEPDTLEDRVEKISELGSGSFTAAKLMPDEIQKIADSAAGLAEIFSDAIAELEAIETTLGFEFPEGLCGFKAVDELFDVVAGVPMNALHLRSAPVESLHEGDSLNALEKQRDELKAAKVRLDLRFETEKLNEHASLKLAAEVLEQKGRLLGVFDTEWRAANAFYMSLCRQKPLIRRTRKRAADLKLLHDFYTKRKEFEANREFIGLLGKAFNGLETPVEDYRALVEWYGAIRGWAGRWFEHSPGVIRAVMRADEESLSGIHELESGGLRHSIQQAIWHLGQMQDAAAGLLSENWFGRRAEASEVAELLSQNLFDRLPDIRHAIHAEQVTPFQAVEKVHPYLRLLNDAELQQNRREYLRVAAEQTPLPEQILSALEQGSMLAKVLWHQGASEKARSLLRSGHDGVGVRQVLLALKETSAQLQAYDRDTGESFHLLGVEPLFCGQPVADTPVGTAIDRFRKALDAGDLFLTWREFAVRLHPEGDPPVPWESLAERLMVGDLDDERIRATAELGLLSRIADRMLEEREVLRDFQGISHEEVRSRLKHVDENIKNLHRAEIMQVAMDRRPPAGNSVGRVKEYTEMGLLRHEINKKKRHVPIRRLTQRAGRSLVALKPCFMMGPLSVAQYLPPGELTFDLIIMDEASQMRPEDSIGAIARAKQVIVVGDPRQLPPTSFFDRLEDEEPVDEDDETVVQGKESILELLMPALGRVRQLNWHYRSQHESLIAFSNEHFYDSRLQVFPSPKSEGAKGTLGVSYRYVEGEYGKQRNHLEAQEVLRGVLREVRRSGGLRTIGVVAVNSQQAELLNDEWSRIIREHPDVESLIDFWAESYQPFFIKNLENVQGDERDVIFISLTYGPDKNGHVYQRFGPINQQNGWRRLNVLFTRAKQNMVVYSSMRSEQITPTPGNRGATALKQFVEYCERGGRPKDGGTPSGRDPDSPFEIEVMGVLSQHGYEAIPQVGVAKFYIDIGVRHPELDTEFVLGVECDGATYHSAKSARDRDHLRQEILEGLGWRIHRIWSVDWYRRRDREVRRLLDAVETGYQGALREKQERERQEVVSKHGKRGDWLGRQQDLIEDEAEAPQETGVEESEGSSIRGIAEPTGVETTEWVEGPSETAVPEPAIDEAEELKGRLFVLRATIEEEFPEIPRERGLLRDEVIELLVKDRPTTREEFGQAIPAHIRQSIDVEQAKNYLGAVLSLCEEYV